MDQLKDKSVGSRLPNSVWMRKLNMCTTHVSYNSPEKWKTIPESERSMSMHKVCQKIQIGEFDEYTFIDSGIGYWSRQTVKDSIRDFQILGRNQRVRMAMNDMDGVQQCWSFIGDRHGDTQGPFTLRELFQQWRLGIIHDFTEVIHRNVTLQIPQQTLVGCSRFSATAGLPGRPVHPMKRMMEKSVKKDLSECITRKPLCKWDRILKMFRFHQKRYEFQSLIKEVNEACRLLDKERLRKCLDEAPLTRDAASALFRPLSACVSFCHLCEKDCCLNPIVSLITMKGSKRLKIDDILECLQICDEYLMRVHDECEEMKEEIKTMEEEKDESNASRIACPCLICSNLEMNTRKNGLLESEQRKDPLGLKYHTLQYNRQLDRDYLRLLCLPRGRKQKHDCRIIDWLIDGKYGRSVEKKKQKKSDDREQLNRVTVMHHHISLCLSNKRIKILNHIWNSELLTFSSDETLTQKKSNLMNEAWLPKHIAIPESSHRKSIVHEYRVSPLFLLWNSSMFADQSLDIPHLFEEYFQCYLSPNFDDLISLISICGDKRTDRKHAMIERLFHSPLKSSWLMKYGMQWLEVCLGASLFRTAALISSELKPLLCSFLCSADCLGWLPSVIIREMVSFLFIPSLCGSTISEWVDLDGNETKTGDDVNLDFCLMLGIGYGVGRVPPMLEMRVPRIFIADRDECEQQSCIHMEWMHGRYFKDESSGLSYRFKLKSSFDVG